MKFFFALLFVLATAAQAQNLKFDQINQNDMDSVAKEFSANFAHTTVSGASSLGALFGFQVGVIGGMTKSPNVDALVKRVDSTQTADKVYNAVISGQLTVPFGITAEASFFPAVDLTLTSSATSDSV